MAEVKGFGPEQCPACGREPVEILAPSLADGILGADTEFFCAACRTQGWRHVFNPPMTVERPEEALPEMAVCVHHPGKRAVAVCAGTGDFICALCKADIDGKSYSIQYLDREGKTPGKEKAPGFDRYLARPDRQTDLWLLLGFCFLGPVGGALAIYYSHKALRLRRENPLYRDLTSAISIWAVLIFSWFLAIIPVLGFVLLLLWID